MARAEKLTPWPIAALLSFMARRVDIPSILIGGCGFLGFLALIIGLDLPAANTMRSMLQQAYTPRRVAIATFKAVTLEDSSGWYRAAGESRRWRYLSARQGLWAEDLSPVWRSPEKGKATADLDDKWNWCMSHTGRGHAMDWLVNPIVVLYLNAR